MKRESADDYFDRSEQARKAELKRLLRSWRAWATEFTFAANWLLTIWLLFTPSILVLLVLGHFSAFNLVDFLTQLQNWLMQLTPAQIPQAASAILRGYVVGGLVASFVCFAFGVWPYRSPMMRRLEMYMMQWHDQQIQLCSSHAAEDVARG